MDLRGRMEAVALTVSLRGYTQPQAPRGRQRKSGNSPVLAPPPPSRCGPWPRSRAQPQRLACARPEPIVLQKEQGPVGLCSALSREAGSFFCYCHPRRTVGPPAPPAATWAPFCSWKVRTWLSAVLLLVHPFTAHGTGHPDVTRSPLLCPRAHTLQLGLGSLLRARRLPGDTMNRTPRSSTGTWGNHQEARWRPGEEPVARRNTGCLVPHTCRNY
ncbi:uncharacterized protein LOC123829383 isoform X2 [Phyllostomus hastatus]|uniref:uncharacterized protein LOC123829383 isoform X2 n=1 Tax=Phyllostomus hastatus TaxID=9423 RepID=UPI001E67F392|nr:uncharacterized protein LOC123829383 isoform X2 [Phyllostomus hastatus]